MSVTSLSPLQGESSFADQLAALQKNLGLNTTNTTTIDTTSERATKKTKYVLRTANSSAPATAAARMEKLSANAAQLETSSKAAKLFPKVPKKLLRNVGKAIQDWAMLKEGECVVQFECVWFQMNIPPSFRCSKLTLFLLLSQTSR